MRVVWFLAQREIVFNLYHVLQYRKRTAFQNGQYNSCTMMVGVTGTRQRIKEMGRLNYLKVGGCPCVQLSGSGICL